MPRCPGLTSSAARTPARAGEESAPGRHRRGAAAGPPASHWSRPPRAASRKRSGRACVSRWGPASPAGSPRHASRSSYHGRPRHGTEPAAGGPWHQVPARRAAVRRRQGHRRPARRLAERPAVRAAGRRAAPAGRRPGRARPALHDVAGRRAGRGGAAAQPAADGAARRAGLELAARYVAGSGNVGGDWYDVFVLPDGKLGVVVGDVAVGAGRPRSSWAGCAARCAPTRWRPQTRRPRCACWTARSSTSSRTRWLPCFTGCTPRRPASSLFSSGPSPACTGCSGLAPGPLPLLPDPPIGTADDPERRSDTVYHPAWRALVLLHRRPGRAARPGDRQGMAGRRHPGQADRRRPSTSGSHRAGGRRRVRPGHAHPGGRAPAQDDIAVLVLSRFTGTQAP